MNSLQFLIKQIEIIEYKYQKINENSIANFNIFSILRRENDEVNLHSKFIYELLNPKGSHNQRDTFLKIFLEEIDCIIDTFEVYREQYNIDILLKAKNQVVIIENKIDTQDHSNQLSRYINTIQKQGYRKNEIKTIYLTLYGEEPNEYIENIILLSYSKNIKNWISRCIEKVAQKPTLRETLIQYLNLINKLTYKSDNQGFIMEVKELLFQKDNLKTILSIEEAIIEAKIEIQLNFWKTVISYLREAQYRFTFYSIYGDRDIKESVYKYYTKKKNRKDYGFEYQVDNNLYFFIEIRDNIYYGFYFKEDTNVDKQIEILDKVKAEWEEPYWKYPNKRLNFEEFNNENILDLLDNNQKEIDIRNISDEVIYLITNYKKELNRC